ncbi:uncharacterized protein LOC128555342 [Mercenaria mercenaria]|uniref:uncharacterized protein LOC128555342 n=1 Tax=Mercenaria mercenaria TaxID=6596 RepID=UPI00234F69B6|nr:uncharacterized protein LOC128555342 [Mercenaria mercenaria]
MYHICEGNPCTNGATCVRGASPADYTCTSRTGKMCRDPGTPGDSKQIVNGYEIGSVLNYTCDRSGFTVTGPTYYTCDYIGNDAVWSNSLAGNLPECRDTETPTFSGSCGQTYDLDAVDRVFFTPGTASDNFAVASFSRTDPLQSGDRLLVDTSVTYTARDYEGNKETCTVTFNVIAKVKECKIIYLLSSNRPL